MWARVRGITYMAYISGDIDRPTFIGVIRRSVIFGAIAGAIAVVAILAIAGFFVVMIAGAAGAIAGAALGFVLGIPRAVFKSISGARSSPPAPRPPM